MEIVNQVFEAVDGEGLLPVGERVSLEYLSHTDDGIFETPRAWTSFVRGNFHEGRYWLDSPKPTTIKKWCYPLKHYSGLFAVKVGVDKWQAVAAENLEFTYDYEPYYSRRDVESLPAGFCSSIELFVTARIK